MTISLGFGLGARINTTIFPTRVGVNPTPGDSERGKRDLPHASGGEPRGDARHDRHSLSSPREWG